LVRLVEIGDFDSKALHDNWNDYLRLLAPHSRKLFADKGESLEGTLFWEYGKIVSELPLTNGMPHISSLLAFEASIDFTESVAPLIK